MEPVKKLEDLVKVLKAELNKLIDTVSLRYTQRIAIQQTISEIKDRMKTSNCRYSLSNDIEIFNIFYQTLQKQRINNDELANIYFQFNFLECEKIKINFVKRWEWFHLHIFLLATERLALTMDLNFFSERFPIIKGLDLNLESLYSSPFAKKYLPVQFIRDTFLRYEWQNSNFDAPTN